MANEFAWEIAGSITIRINGIDIPAILLEDGQIITTGQNELMAGEISMYEAKKRRTKFIVHVEQQRANLMAEINKN